MSGYVVQVTLVFLLTFLNTQAKKPPGYVAPAREYDPNPPKYEYGYRIQDDQSTHGKDEQRDGIYAQGRYYVENGKDSNQSVKYFADDWGYHPVVEYSSAGPHSKTSTNFALGIEAIKLKNNQKSIPQDPSDPGKAESLAKADPSAQQPTQPTIYLDPASDVQPMLLQPTPQVPVEPNSDHSDEVEDPTSTAPQDPSAQITLHNDPHLQVLNEPAYDPASQQPLFYFVQPGHNFPSDLESFVFNTQQTVPAGDQQLQLLEPLPQPQALHDSNLETAKLIKLPDQIVHHKEFGAKLEPKHTNVDFKNLIESTKNLVSGEDVLNINAAAGNGTLESLLEQFVTPTIVDNHINVQVSSTTFAPEASLQQEPIIVADFGNCDKPVDEKTDENIGYGSSTARSTLATSALSESNSEVIVTPRPVSPAGIQMQNVDEQLLNSKTLVQIQKTIPYYLGMYEYPTELNVDNATSLEQAAVENIALGKTLLYFPQQEAPRAEALEAAIESNHLVEQQLEFDSKKEDSTGLDNTSLQHEYIYERPRQELDNVSPQIVEKPVHVPVEVTRYVDRPYPVEVPVPYPQPYPVEKIVKQIVKEPYPVEVKVPVHVEKLVERKIPVPYYIEKPVEKIVEKPVPHYIDRPATSSQAFLLQIPGLFTQQKYSSLVQNTNHQQPILKWQNPFNQEKTIHQRLQLGQNNFNKYAGYPIVYAPQNFQYLPGKQNIQINKGHKLRKLNLLVFPPRGNYFNLPPITNNPNDLVQNKHAYQTFRHSNAQLNNGYLPPQNVNNDHQAASSIATAHASNNQIGLLPPKQHFHDDINKDHQAAASIATAQASNNHIGLLPPKQHFHVDVNKDHQAAESIATAHGSNRPVNDHVSLLPPKNHFYDNTGKYRGGRSFFDDKSIRLEYGFMPPLIPSLEIDEHGQPVERDDNKH